MGAGFIILGDLSTFSRPHFKKNGGGIFCFDFYIAPPNIYYSKIIIIKEL